MRWLLLVMTLIVPVCASAGEMGKCRVFIQDKQWNVEKAVTLEERRNGLMNRKRVKPGTGMLFLFDAPAEASMWMKDTLVPLDMLFIGEDGRIVYIEHRAKPKSLEPVNPPGKMRAVLEIPGGEAKKAGIGIGDEVDMKRCY